MSHLKKEKNAFTHGAGGLVGPRAGLDDVGEKKFLDPAGFLNSDRPARSIDSIATTLYRLPRIQAIAYNFFYSHSRDRFIVR